MEGQVPQTLVFGAFTLDLARGSLRHGENEIKLRPKSFEMLCYLVENRGRLISSEELMRAVWEDTAVSDNSVAQCLREIRRALGSDGQTMIRNVPRRGYTFDALVTGVARPGGTGRSAGERPYIPPSRSRLRIPLVVLAVIIPLAAAVWVWESRFRRPEMDSQN
jgi:DNA-binding winged helix-turn-helix (wHTH) protein